MGKDVHYTYKRGTPLTPEEIAMIEAARNLPVEEDEDSPEIAPVKTPRIRRAGAGGGKEKPARC